jgi:outer membrane receptor protein involved in Fe transport
MAVSSNNHTVVDSRGIYLQDQIRLNDQWQILAGVRFDQFEVETTNKLRNLSEKQDSNSTSPRLGVVYTPWRDHSFYASWSKTYSPVGGGLIGITPGAAGNTNDTDPELTRQKEIGVKSDWLDQRLTTTLAIYELELYNRRTRDPIDPNITLMRPAAFARHRADRHRQYRRQLVCTRRHRPAGREDRRGQQWPGRQPHQRRGQAQRQPVRDLEARAGLVRRNRHDAGG